MATTAEQFIKHLLDLLKAEEECTTEHYLPDGSVTIQVHCNDTLFETGETDCSIKVTLAESDASEQRNLNMQQAYELSKAELQEQADIIHAKILSLAGFFTVTRYTEAIHPDYHQECQSHRDELSEAIIALLAIKKELGLASNLSKMSEK
jgi:hypothetical protein